MQHINQLHFNDLNNTANTFKSKQPYPYIILDNFLQDKSIEYLNKEFNVELDQTIHYKHTSQDKKGLTKYNLFSENIKSIIDELYSDDFLEIISKISGYKNIKGDKDLHGGGLHQIENGGYLKIHRDFATHPKNKTWIRRVNLLLYINPIWKKEWNGDLEFWDENLENKIESISPNYNRCVLFDTTKNFHGHPKPLETPEGMKRRSLALYYFEETDKTQNVKSTFYTTTSEDNFKTKFMVFFDRQLVNFYNQLKRYTGIDDKKVEKILNFLRRPFGK